MFSTGYSQKRKKENEEEEKDEEEKYMSSESPLAKKARNLRQMYPRFSVLLLHESHNRYQCFALKKQGAKKHQEEATEYANVFLAKRIKETKQKCQERITKRHRPAPLRAPTSKSPVRSMSLRVTNK